MPNANRTKNVAPNTARSARRWRSAAGSTGGSAAVVGLPRRRLDELDPDVVRIEDEGDAPGAAGKSVRFLLHADVLLAHPHQRAVEVRHLEGEVVELLAGLEGILPFPVRELDPRARDRVLHERDLGVILGDRAPTLELEAEDLGVEPEALLHVSDRDRGVQETHRRSSGDGRREVLNFRAHRYGCP